MKKVFVETDNMRRLREAMDVLADVEKSMPGLAMVYGKAGHGKTMATERIHITGENSVFLRVRRWSPHAMFRAIAQELVGSKPYGVERCQEVIARALEQHPRCIFIDEADRLPLPLLEDLRDISDVSGCPVILIGEEGLSSKLSAHFRLWSRVVEEVFFGPVDVMDVMVYASEAAGLKMDREAAERMTSRAGGDFRVVHNLMVKLEKLAKTKQTRDIDVSMVNALAYRGAQ